VRDNQADYLRAVLHQLPYYIPSVLFANVINIFIFAVVMGAVELLPNLLLMLSGSGKVQPQGLIFFFFIFLWGDILRGNRYLYCLGVD
jgi:hypothetical protein